MVESKHMVLSEDNSCTYLQLGGLCNLSAIDVYQRSLAGEYRDFTVVIFKSAVFLFDISATELNVVTFTPLCTPNSIKVNILSLRKLAHAIYRDF